MKLHPLVCLALLIAFVILCDADAVEDATHPLDNW